MQSLKHKRIPFVHLNTIPDWIEIFQTEKYYAALDKYAVDIEVVNAVDLNIEKESTAISEELAEGTPNISVPNESSNPFGGNSMADAPFNSNSAPSDFNQVTDDDLPF